MSRFLDLFHHRMLLLFYRAWATAQPTVSHDHPATNRFVTYVGALAGLGLPALRDRDDFPDAAKLFYAGRLGGADAQRRRPGRDHRRLLPDAGADRAVRAAAGSPCPRRTNGAWAWPGARGGALGADRRSRASASGAGSRSSASCSARSIAGSSSACCRAARACKKLTALVRNYVGDELLWDVRLVLDEQTEEPCRLGRSRLGWTSWLGRPELERGRREDLISGSRRPKFSQTAA